MKAVMGGSWKRFLSNHEPIIILVAGILLLLPCVWCETSITDALEWPR